MKITTITLVVAMLLSAATYACNKDNFLAATHVPATQIAEGDFVTLASHTLLSGQIDKLENLDALSHAYKTIKDQRPDLRQFLKSLDGRIPSKDAPQVQAIYALLQYKQNEGKCVRISCDTCLVELMRAFRGTWESYKFNCLTREAEARKFERVF